MSTSDHSSVFLLLRTLNWGGSSPQVRLGLGPCCHFTEPSSMSVLRGYVVMIIRLVGFFSYDNNNYHSLYYVLFHQLI